MPLEREILQKPNTRKMTNIQNRRILSPGVHISIQCELANFGSDTYWELMEWPLEDSIGLGMTGSLHFYKVNLSGLFYY